jgi:hypothetical protein
VFLSVFRHTLIDIGPVYCRLTPVQPLWSMGHFLMRLPVFGFRILPTSHAGFDEEEKQNDYHYDYNNDCPIDHVPFYILLRFSSIFLLYG